MIGELGSIKSRADEFEKDRGSKDLLAIAIINIGFYLDLVTYKPHATLAESCGYKAPENSTDGSVYSGKYALTALGQPIGLPEYCAHIATGQKTHVMNFFDHDNTKHSAIAAKHIDPKEDFHEFQLMQRPGQARLSLAFKTNTDQLLKYFRDMREYENQNAFQIPHHLGESGVFLKAFEAVAKREQFILDLRTVEEKELIRHNQPRKTFKTTTKVY